MSLVPGIPIQASTQRPPGHLAQGATGADTTHLSQITLRQIAGILFQPVSQQFMQDMFGVAVEQPNKVYADWTNPNNEQWPVAPKDFLVVNGTLYPVTAVKNFPSQYICIYVGLEIE